MYCNIMMLEMLHKQMFEYYTAYMSGKMPEQMYLQYMKTIDIQVDKIELSSLKYMRYGVGCDHTSRSIHKATQE